MLSKLIVAELRRIGADAPNSPHVVELGGGALPAVRLELFDLDRYSAALGRIAVSGGTLPPIDAAAPDAAAQRSERLNALARTLTAQLSYLEEPLAVVEQDAEAQVALLRSLPPQRDERAICYWELTVDLTDRTTLSLARYEWAPGRPEREPLPYPVAFSQLGRIADSLAGAMA